MILAWTTGAIYIRRLDKAPSQVTFPPKGHIHIEIMGIGVL